MKNEIEQIIANHIDRKISLGEAATQILRLFDVASSYSATEIEEMKRLAHEGLPNDCVAGWDEVKFCPHRQGDGNLCKWCSNYC